MSETGRLPLKGCVALVTGGGRGIGRAIALRLAHDGACVAVNSRSDHAAASTVVEEIQTSNGAAMHVPADVSDLEQVRAMIGQIEAELGPVNILVNNADWFVPSLFADNDPE